MKKEIMKSIVRSDGKVFLGGAILTDTLLSASAVMMDLTHIIRRRNESCHRLC